MKFVIQLLSVKEKFQLLVDVVECLYLNLHFDFVTIAHYYL